jgi:formamidopyrimidine-DNA glycosylase
MPELPEVETFVRNLAPAIGRTIAAAEVLDVRLALCGESFVGARINGIRRRGKQIVFNLGERGDLVIHLRMSGRLRLECSATEVPYTRLILRLDDGQCVYFVNPRRLGTAVFFPNGFAEPLGLEPLDAEFTPAAFASLTAKSKAPIKQLLLDQRRIAGIGNIYAAEALWRAEIDPRRPSNQLGRREVAKLHKAILDVLHDAVDQLGTTLGTSVSDYRPTAAEGGSFQNHLAVYGREGEACERCEGRIERVIQAGRSTCFCPSCQR